MKDDKRYWLYVGNPGVAMLHRSDCGRCNDGRGNRPDNDHTKVNWYGFYATRGAADDAARSGGWELSEDICISWD